MKKRIQGLAATASLAAMLFASGAVQAQQTLRYGVNFLGQDITSNTAFGTRTCARAGVGSAALLPIRATLREGGAGKAPSAAYGDIVSITFTPVVAASSAQSCAG